MRHLDDGPLADLLRGPAHRRDDRDDRRDPAFVDIDELRAGVAGTVFDTLVRDLPDSPHELAAALGDDHDDDELHKRVTQAVAEALATAGDDLTDRAERTLDFLGPRDRMAS